MRLKLLIAKAIIHIQDVDRTTKYFAANGIETCDEIEKPPG